MWVLFFSSFAFVERHLVDKGFHQASSTAQSKHPSDRWLCVFQNVPGPLAALPFRACAGTSSQPPAPSPWSLTQKVTLKETGEMVFLLERVNAYQFAVPHTLVPRLCKSILRKWFCQDWVNLSGFQSFLTEPKHARISLGEQLRERNVSLLRHTHRGKSQINNSVAGIWRWVRALLWDGVMGVVVAHFLWVLFPGFPVMAVCRSAHIAGLPRSTGMLGEGIHHGVKRSRDIFLLRV